MSHLLDSNIVIYQLAGIPEVVSLVSRLAPDGIAISIVTYMEAYQSTLRSDDQAYEEQGLPNKPIMPRPRPCSGRIPASNIPHAASVTPSPVRGWEVRVNAPNSAPPVDNLWQAA